MLVGVLDGVLVKLDVLVKVGVAVLDGVLDGVAVYVFVLVNVGV